MTRDVSLVDLIVHELRTPLTVALGSIRHAESADPAGAADALARARRSCERLERLAGEMRDYVRVAGLRETALAPVAVDAIVETAVARLAGERDVSVAIGAVPARQVVALKGQVESAMTALLLALARAASPTEGLAISFASDGAGVTITARRESATLPERPETFDAEWLGGLGFGLPLARAVVERGGGSINSTVAGDGRLGAVIVTLVAASTPPPA